MSWSSSEQLRAEQHWFQDQVAVLCTELHGSVISGGRSAVHNRAVGGMPGSLHLWSKGALACDISFPTMAAKGQAKVKARNLRLHWNDSKPDTTALHVQARPAKKE